MALYQYFRMASDVPRSLPDPCGPLSKEMPLSSIAAANSDVKALLQGEEAATSGKRGQYAKFTPELKLEIGKCAAEHGVAANIRYYSRRFELKESSIWTWRNAYTCTRQQNGGDITAVTSLPERKRGCPFLLGEESDKQVRTYITTLSNNGAVVNTAIAISCAEGIVKNKDSNLLVPNVGHISLTKYWGKNLLRICQTKNKHYGQS